MPWNNNEKDQKLIYPTEFRLKTKFEFYGFYGLLDFTPWRCFQDFMVIYKKKYFFKKLSNQPIGIALFY